MKSILVTQSNYIPWRGYLSLIASVDELVFLDNVQYTRRDWRNRNLVRSAAKSKESKWLTIPLENGGSRQSTIQETRISASSNWTSEHTNRIRAFYQASEYYDDLSPILEVIESSKSEAYLSKVNRHIIECICDVLGLQVSIRTSVFAEDLSEIDPSQRILNILLETKADLYLTGPAAKSYLDEELFKEKNIAICYADYSRLPYMEDLISDRGMEFSILDAIARHGTRNTRNLLFDLK